MKTEEEIQADVQWWFRVWAEAAPARLCTLLVVGYFRTRGPFDVEGEEKYLQLNQPHGLKFLELVEASADRQLTAIERATASREGIEAIRVFRRAAIASEGQPQFDPEVLLDCLWEPLVDPLRAANRLVLAGYFAPSYSAIQQVRECFCPANWLAVPPEWTLPPEALSWAKRIYAERAFSDLPILADMLEDADCPDRPLLEHCRNCPAHFRGCAALDRLLGRK